MMTAPLPSTDGVRVAVRMRPFSQVSDGGDAAWLKLGLGLAFYSFC